MWQSALTVKTAFFVQYFLEGTGWGAVIWRGEPDVADKDFF